jgi:hypothetical protein
MIDQRLTSKASANPCWLSPRVSRIALNCLPSTEGSVSACGGSINAESSDAICQMWQFATCINAGFPPNVNFPSEQPEKLPKLRQPHSVAFRRDLISRITRSLTEQVGEGCGWPALPCTIGIPDCQQPWRRHMKDGAPELRPLGQWYLSAPFSGSIRSQSGPQTRLYGDSGASIRLYSCRGGLGKSFWRTHSR